MTFGSLSVVCLGQHYTRDFDSQALLLFVFQHKGSHLGSFYNFVYVCIHTPYNAPYIYRGLLGSHEQSKGPHHRRPRQHQQGPRLPQNQVDEHKTYPKHRPDTEELIRCGHSTTPWTDENDSYAHAFQYGLSSDLHAREKKRLLCLACHGYQGESNGGEEGEPGKGGKCLVPERALAGDIEGEPFITRGGLAEEGR